LVEFHIAGNNIKEIPRSIGGMKNLEVLDLKKNKISEIPVEFGILVKLLKLDLEDN
jgi:Leucine-rich repeat (LRR) protein